MNPVSNQQRLQQTQNILAQTQPPPPDALGGQQMPTQTANPSAGLQNLAGSNQQLGNALQSYHNQQSGGGDANFSGGGQPGQANALQNWAGLCEAWAEQQAFGKQGIFPSAIAAASHFARNGQLNPDVQNAPAGSLIYFNADNSNGGYGHVMQSDGKGNITGATYGGVKTMPLQSWIQGTKQQPIGYVKP